MDEARGSAEHDRTTDGWRAARERSEDLQRRIREVALQVAVAEEGVAAAYEASARLRPHAAERLHAAAQEARDFAERERRVAAERAPRDGRATRPDTPGGPLTAEGA
jgi:hypothetical protein